MVIDILMGLKAKSSTFREFVKNVWNHYARISNTDSERFFFSSET